MPGQQADSTERNGARGIRNHRKRLLVLLILAVAGMGALAILFLCTGYFPKTEEDYFDPTAGRVRTDSRVVGIRYASEVRDGMITPYYRQLFGSDLPTPVWLPCIGFKTGDVPRLSHGEDVRASFYVLGRVLDRESLTDEMRRRVLSQALKAASLDDYQDQYKRARQYIDAVSTLVGQCSWYEIPLEMDLIPMLEDTENVRLGRAWRWVNAWLEEKLGPEWKQSRQLAADASSGDAPD